METGSRESLERLAYFRREVEKILKEFFNSALEGLGVVPFASNVPLDILETAEEIRIQAELPGFMKGDIKLEVMRDTLIISGVKKSDQKTGKVNQFNSERKYGEFSRELELPVACDTRKVDATYSRGLLTIVIPRIAERRGEKRLVGIVWDGKDK